MKRDLKKEYRLKNKVTVLVNSCDAYSDLWNPFFCLFSKYGNSLRNCGIVLNTERRKFTFDGLGIQCLDISKDYYNLAWGRRLRDVLGQVNTPYVLFLLDDFFLRGNVDDKVIYKCVSWMESDAKIGAMNLMPLDYVYRESKYKGFCLVKPGIIYRVNAQACIWRVDVLRKSILDRESAWDWEIYGNLRNDVLLTSDIYSLKWGHREPFPYGFYEYGKINGQGRAICQSAVEKGLWNVEVVSDIFKKAGIEIDYNERGINPTYYRQIPRNNRLLNILVKPLRKIKYKKNVNAEAVLELDSKKIDDLVVPYLNDEKF